MLLSAYFAIPIELFSHLCKIRKIYTDRANAPGRTSGEIANTHFLSCIRIICKVSMETPVFILKDTKFQIF